MNTHNSALIELKTVIAVDTLIAGEVRAELARRRLSQVELASTIGVTRAYLKRRLSGMTPWSIDDLVAIARTLDVTVASLVAPVDAVLAESRAGSDTR